MLAQLIEDLQSSNCNEKIKAIKFIGEEAHCTELEPILLDMLSSENDLAILNALALSLGKLDSNDAVPILMGYVKNPKYIDKRGSFLYAMTNLDCKEYFFDFVELICVGNFEVFSHSFLIFESILDDIEYDKRFEAKVILEKQQKIELSKPKSKLPQFERINFINKALEMLND